MAEYTYFLPDRTIQRYEHYISAARFPIGTIFYWESHHKWGLIRLSEIDQQLTHCWKQLDDSEVPAELRVKQLLLS